MSFVLGSMLSEGAGGLLKYDEEQRANQNKLDLSRQLEEMKHELEVKARKASMEEIMNSDAYKKSLEQSGSDDGKLMKIGKLAGSEGMINQEALQAYRDAAANGDEASQKFLNRLDVDDRDRRRAIIAGAGETGNLDKVKPYIDLEKADEHADAVKANTAATLRVRQAISDSREEGRNNRADAAEAGKNERAAGNLGARIAGLQAKYGNGTGTSGTRTGSGVSVPGSDGPVSQERQDQANKAIAEEFKNNKESPNFQKLDQDEVRSVAFEIMSSDTRVSPSTAVSQAIGWISKGKPREVEFGTVPNKSEDPDDKSPVASGLIHVAKSSMGAGKRATAFVADNERVSESDRDNYMLDRAGGKYDKKLGESNLKDIARAAAESPELSDALDKAYGTGASAAIQKLLTRDANLNRSLDTSKEVASLELEVKKALKANDRVQANELLEKIKRLKKARTG